MNDADAAQLIAGIALALLTAILAIRGGRNDTVTESAATYTVGTVLRTVTRGTVISESDLPHIGNTPVRTQRRSALGAILVGKDNRTSTSKTVMFAWTLAVAFGLLSLLIAVWLGDHGPWDAQVERGLQEEYLLLLGGPIAAAVLAKYAAVSQSDTRTDAPVGQATASDLVNDDQGDTDIGDFQYTLFNAIALAFFLGDFIGDLPGGFPELPPLLAGLVLTSTGGYAAKKLVGQLTPTLTSVVPAVAAPGDEIKIFGANLTVPANVSDTGADVVPLVMIGSQKATVTAHDLVLGNDRITVTVPATVSPGSAPISATRGDGAAARGPTGANILAFEVTAADAQ